MNFQPGDKVKYIDEPDSDGPETGKIYTVARRSERDNGVHLEEFPAPDDWWYDYRFQLYESPIYVVLTKHTYEVPSGSFNPRIEGFTKAQKFTKEELKIWLEKEHKSISNPAYEVFRCVPVRINIKVQSIIEIEE